MSKELKISGILTDILKTETGESNSGKSWTRRSFVIDSGASFNPTICFGLFGEEKSQMIEAFEVGATLEVAFNVSSREYNGKYYHNIDAWQINEVGAQSMDEMAEDEFSKKPILDEDVPF